MAFQPRRSGRNPGPPANNQPVFSTNQARAPNQNNQAQQNFNNQKQFQNQNPLPQPPAIPPGLMQPGLKQDNQQPPQKQDASATGKALQQMETDEEGKKGGKEKWKKGGKLPLALKKKRMNQRLSKILTPKNALILLHEFKPGCTYKVQEQVGTNPPMFVAMVEHNETILATGQGMSKAQAKNTAAENAIKAIVSQAMTQQRLPNQQPPQQQQAENSSQDGDEPMDEESDSKDPASALPWAGLASFAIYKMFTEWQNQGAEVPMTRPAITKSKKKVLKRFNKFGSVDKSKMKVALKREVENAPKAQAVKKELPANAAELHPSVLLNTMRPGIVAVEISRTPGPNSTVTMGYEVDGRMFTGVAGNKKDAKKEAAKAVVSALYGLQYPQPAAPTATPTPTPTPTA